MTDPAAAPVPDEPGVGDATARSPRARRGWVYTLTIVAAVIMLIAGLGTWAKRQVLDTDNWVDASDELLANDEIRGALSTYLVDQLYDNVDVAAALEERLPDNFQRLAPTLAAALRQPATTAVDRLLSTDEARAIWQRVNRRAHEALVRVLKDETRAESVSTTGGKVTLDLGELVRHLASKLGIPDSVIDRIPAGAGQIVVAESGDLSAAQKAVTVIEWTSVLLFLLVGALFAAAVVLAQGWRRVALRNVGVALVIVGLLVVLIRRVTGTYLINNFTKVEENRGVVSAVWAIATHLLRDIGWNSVAIGVLILLAAALAGPSKPARAVRRFIAPVFVGNPAVLWGSAAVLFLLLVHWVPLPLLETWYGVLIAAVVLALAIEALRRVCEHDKAMVTDAAPRDVPTPQPS